MKQIAIKVPVTMWNKIVHHHRVDGATHAIHLMLKDDADCYLPSTWLVRFMRVDGEAIWYIHKPTTPARLKQLEAVGFDIYNDFEV